MRKEREQRFKGQRNKSNGEREKKRVRKRRQLQRLGI